MNIGILACGTDGDIIPLVALSSGLAKNHHNVNLILIPFKERDYSYLNAYPKIKVDIYKFYELDFNDKENDSSEFWNSKDEKAQAYIQSRNMKLIPYLEKASLALCNSSEVIIGNQHNLFLSCYAEKMKKCYFTLCYEPECIKTKYYPPANKPNKSIEENLQYWKEFEDDCNNKMLDSVNQLRTILGLAHVKDTLDEVAHSKVLNLISFSSHLFANKPKDWEGRHYTCGYIKNDIALSLKKMPQELADFINDGEPPIFVSFGNMVLYENNLTNFQNSIIEGIRKLGKRAVFQSNWEENPEEIEGIYKLSGFIYLPSVINKCSVFIHAAGTGFVHYAAESGIPSLVIPYGFNHYYNAAILQRLGVSKEYIGREDFTTEKFLITLRLTFNNKQLFQNAKILGEKVRSENGLATAVKLIEEKYAQELEKQN